MERHVEDLNVMEVKDKWEMVRDRPEYRKILLEAKVHKGPQCCRRSKRRRVGRGKERRGRSNKRRRGMGRRRRRRRRRRRSNLS
jgi:hypothetical protein